MFSVAILVGIYSYLIFLLGIAHLLYTPVILFITILFILISANYHKKELIKLRNELYSNKVTQNKSSRIILFLIFLICLVNLIGALGPETGFDALWYHLTLPKIFLMEHRIFHIPGSLFYYSDMPKLSEMLYIPSLSMHSDLLARLTHYIFGLLILLALYKLSRKFFDEKWSLVSVLIFASNLVFSWESKTAYVDLFRTFFEIMALWGFVNWYAEKDNKWLTESAVMLGLAFSTKLLALGSVFIFIFLILYLRKAKNLPRFLLYSLFIPLPWFFLSFVNTGNPIYPFFTSHLSAFPLHLNLNPSDLISTFFNQFLRSQDPLTPLYAMLAPLLVLAYKKADRLKPIIVYVLISLVVWYTTPQVGGGRYIIPYLPAFSLVAVYLIRFNEKYKKFLYSVVILVAVSTIGYRFIANAKVIPVVLGFESKEEYLVKNLNFNYGDFYDTDKYFANTLRPNDKVLLYGFHNLYYVDFPFVDSSYVKPGDRFTYIATQNIALPSRFFFWHLVYENPVTHVKLYSMGGINWYY